MNVLEKFAKVKVFVFDLDGVLTNGMLYLQSDGTFMRAMNIKDGYALQLAVKKGYSVWVISGGNAKEAKERLQRLGINEVHFGVKDKKELLKLLMTQYQIDAANVLYMGDDMPDKEAMELCALRTTPNDAADDIKQLAHYISHCKGGEGCVRDVIEKTLKINNDWE